MTGQYDNNETEQYIEMSGLEFGHWYLDQDGALYIVPDEKYGFAEIEGPDTDTLEKLNNAYRETGFDKVDRSAIAKDNGLEIIPDVLKRFSPGLGYYNA